VSVSLSTLLPPSPSVRCIRALLFVWGLKGKIIELLCAVLHMAVVDNDTNTYLSISYSCIHQFSSRFSFLYFVLPSLFAALFLLDFVSPVRNCLGRASMKLPILRQVGRKSVIQSLSMLLTLLMFDLAGFRDESNGRVLTRVL